jgi:glycosyltransferase involved in cell wall biosynthesis
MSKNICMISVHGDPLGVLGTPDTGGQCLYIKEISKKLIKLGYRTVDSYTRYWGNRKKEELIDGLENCRVIRIPCVSTDFIPKERLRPHLTEFYNNMKEYIEKKNFDYDLCHTHYWDGGLVGTWMSRDYQIPQIHTSHSLGAIKKATSVKDGELNYNQRIEDEKTIYSAATTIIAESTQEKKDLIEIYDVNSKKIHIIFAGVDIDWFFPRGSREEAKKQLNQENEFFILSLGRLDPRKGFDLLIKAVPHLIDSLRSTQKKLNVTISAGNKGSNGELFLSKSEQKEYDRLIKLCGKFNIQDKFKIIPRIDFDQVPLYYTAADVFVVPSRYETFGLVIIEAMACGTPVVATNIGGPPDIINDGIDGYTEDPNRPQEFASKIIKIITNPDHHREMSESAKKTATTKFSWNAITKQISDLYNKILG